MRVFNPKLNFVSYNDLLSAIREQIHLLPREFDLIVGVPRSGMIPACAIALHLNVPVMDQHSFICNIAPRHGNTRKLKKAPAKPMEAASVLVVEDSVFSGRSLVTAVQQIRESGFRGRLATCAAIVSPEKNAIADFHFIECAPPRVFEWNLFHHNIIENACLDLDGVLCVDPDEEDNDDGEQYRRFLLSAKLLHLPTPVIAHIVSARLEKYRAETETWLERQGIRYRQLHLLDLPSKGERIRRGAHIPHKVSVYRSTGADLFIESSLDQANAIAAHSGKPVLWVGGMKLIPGTGLHGSVIMESTRRWRRGKVAELERKASEVWDGIRRRLGRSR